MLNKRAKVTKKSGALSRKKKQKHKWVALNALNI